MKLRIKGNSIRFRLSQQEVSSLVENGSVSDQCKFSSSTLTYSLKGAADDSFSARFEGQEIIVKLPSSLLVNWDIDERVGFDHHTAEGLYLLIEKDWQCLKPRAHEDESDLYINPQA